MIVYRDGLSARLVDLSLGGCKIKSSVPSQALSPGEKLKTKFQWTDHQGDFFESQGVEGRVAHITPAGNNPDSDVYFGLEFSEKGRSELSPLIELLKWRSKDH